MKRTLIWTFVIGMVIIIILNFFLPDNLSIALAFLYLASPAAIFCLVAIFILLGYHGYPKIVLPAALPTFAGLGLLYLCRFNTAFFFWLLWRVPLLIILATIMILENKLHKLFAGEL